MKMPIFPEEYVQRLKVEFETLTTYESKLSFFDKVFLVIPYEFPTFSANLSAIFDRTVIQEIIRNALRERTRRTTLERTFSYSGRKYTFDIYPDEGSVIIYNNYVICRFLEQQITPIEYIERHTDASRESAFVYKTLLESAQARIHEVETIVNSTTLTFHRDKFAVKFFQAFQAAKTGDMPDLSLLESLHTLYLYAIGIWFYKYTAQLSELANGVKVTTADFIPSEYASLKERIQLMHDLGIIDFLTEEFSHKFPEDVKHHVAEVLCKIIGEPAYNTQHILRLMIKG